MDEPTLVDARTDAVFACGSDGMYGHVDGPRPENVPGSVANDPFEATLALCRMLHLHYRLTERDGKWACSVGSQSFPGDFLGKQTGQRIFTVVNAPDRTHGLRCAISMAVSALWSSCEQWRKMVATTNEYRRWFKDETTDETPV